MVTSDPPAIKATVMSPKAAKNQTVAADSRVRQGRLDKAVQFLRVADDARLLADDQSVSDAAVTLCVHAGIAAADAICAKAIDQHSQGSDHRHAIQLLKGVDANASKHLSALLAMKTRAGYGHAPVSAANLRRAARAAESLVTIALSQ